MPPGRSEENTINEKYRKENITGRYSSLAELTVLPKLTGSVQALFSYFE